MHSSALTADAIIAKYSMRPLPGEGGYFVENYRSKQVIEASALPKHFETNRSLSTSILYLLKKGQRSLMHRLRADENWHFYLGGPLHLGVLCPFGDSVEVTLGQDIRSNQYLQYVVEAGNWFGAYLHQDADYALVGCTVAPGFEFEDFELGSREDLFCRFPNQVQLISKLTDG